jgi:hypothetical protein
MQAILAAILYDLKKLLAAAAPTGVVSQYLSTVIFVSKYVCLVILLKTHPFIVLNQISLFA